MRAETYVEGKVMEGPTNSKLLSLQHLYYTTYYHICSPPDATNINHMKIAMKSLFMFIVWDVAIHDEHN